MLYIYIYILPIYSNYNWLYPHDGSSLTPHWGCLACLALLGIVMICHVGFPSLSEVLWKGMAKYRSILNPRCTKKKLFGLVHISRGQNLAQMSFSSQGCTLLLSECQDKTPSGTVRTLPRHAFIQHILRNSHCHGAFPTSDCVTARTCIDDHRCSRKAAATTMSGICCMKVEPSAQSSWRVCTQWLSWLAWAPIFRSAKFIQVGVSHGISLVKPHAVKNPIFPDQLWLTLN